MINELNDLRVLVQDLFPYLFDQYGFRIVFSQESKEHYARVYRIGLEASMRIVFLYVTATTEGANLGTLEDPFGEVGNWIDAELILTYLQKQPVRYDEYPFQPGVDRDEASFRALSEELKPFMPTILEMFRSKERVAEWLPDFDRYRREDFKRRYGMDLSP